VKRLVLLVMRVLEQVVEVEFAKVVGLVGVIMGAEVNCRATHSKSFKRHK